MNIYTSETEYLKTEVQRLRALVRAQQITIDKLETQPEQEPVAFINVEQRKLEWAKYMSWDTPTVVNLPKIPLYTTPPQRTEERNFCPRCGKRTGDLTSIHTCTPPQEKYTYGTPLMDAMKGNT